MGYAREKLFEIPETAVNGKDKALSIGKKRIKLNNQLLFSKAGDELEFFSFSGVNYAAVFERFSQGRQAKTWIGYLKDHGKQYRVIITLNKNRVIGRIATPEGNLHIKSTQDGTLLLDYEREGMKGVPFGNDFLIPDNEPSLPGESSALEPVPVNVEASPTVSGSNTIVDVLVLYNDLFVSENSNDPLTRIDFLTALANQAYLDSQVSMQIRLAHTELMSYDNSATNYTLLSDISGSGDSTVGNAVSSLREQYGADLVIFVRPYQYPEHGNCGYSNLNNAMNDSWVFATASDGIDVNYVAPGTYYYCSDNTYAHELGHTMGLAHDIDHASTAGSHPYSYGHGIDGTFGTIMSYWSPDVYYFSNPGITCNSNPCGITDAADNARSLETDKNLISAFRDEVNNTAFLNSVYLLLF